MCLPFTCMALAILALRLRHTLLPAKSSLFGIIFIIVTKDASVISIMKVCEVLSANFDIYHFLFPTFIHYLICVNTQRLGGVSMQRCPCFDIAVFDIQSDGWFLIIIHTLLNRSLFWRYKKLCCCQWRRNCIFLRICYVFYH